MARRDELVAEWRARLEECERALAEECPNARWTWVRRMYARVLRYLISQYDRGWNAAAGDAESGERRHRTEYHEAEHIGPGKPARSATAIRSVLDSVHDSIAPGTPLGPRAAGLEPDDFIIAQTIRSPLEAAATSDWLEKQGIAARLTRAGRRATRLWVKSKDYRRAQALLEDRRTQALLEKGMPTANLELVTEEPRAISKGLGWGIFAGFGAAFAFSFLIGGWAIVFLIIGPILGAFVGTVVHLLKAE